MYLLDTGVVFELRKARAGRTDPVFASWASGLARQNLFISALTLLELDNGAARVARGDKAAGLALREWIDNQVMSLTIATRNPAAFKAGRVKVLNPWTYTPDTADDDGDWRLAAKAGPLWLKNLFVRG